VRLSAYNDIFRFENAETSTSARQCMHAAKFVGTRKRTCFLLVELSGWRRHRAYLPRTPPARCRQFSRIYCAEKATSSVWRRHGASYVAGRLTATAHRFHQPAAVRLIRLRSLSSTLLFHPPSPADAEDRSMTGRLASFAGTATFAVKRKSTASNFSDSVHV